MHLFPVPPPRSVRFPGLATAAGLLFVAVPAAAQFVDVTPPDLADPGRGWGVVFADFDGDGEPDIYYENTNVTVSRLFLHVDADSFVAAPPIPVPWALHGCAVDEDNDGDLDLLLRRPGLTDRLLRNDGAAFVDVSFAPLDDNGQSRAAAWADYDLDGDLDVYYAIGPVEDSRLYRNDGPREFVDVTASPLGQESYDDGAVWGDYDNDGDPDLYVQSTSPYPNKLFRNDGAAGFADVTAAPLGNLSSGRGAAWADYDNDGDLDLYLANYGACQLLRNDGSGFTDVTANGLQISQDTYAPAWGDYDNDGWLDLYVATFSGPNHLFHNETDGTFTDLVVPGVTDVAPTLGAAWADHDGDGDLDLYCANYEAPNKLFRNDLANGNHWLHVDVIGTASNRFAVGARVLLQAGGVQQMREVGGDVAYLSQGSFTAEFGLGAAGAVDALAVIWPTGEFQPVAVTGVDQRITVVEAGPGVAAPEVAAAGPALELLGAFPNPVRAWTAVRFALPGAARVRLTMHDVAGRRIGVLEDGVRSGGEHAVRWDGRASGGAPVPSGVYFVRLDAGGVVRTGRVVVAR